jgi:hypothetical protein
MEKQEKKKQVNQALIELREPFVQAAYFAYLRRL